MSIASSVFYLSIIGIIVLGIVFQIFWYSAHCKFLSLFRPHEKWGPADHSKRLYRRFYIAGSSERWRDPNYKCNHICLRDTKCVKMKEKLLQRKRDAYLEFINPTGKITEPGRSDMESESMIQSTVHFD